MPDLTAPSQNPPPCGDVAKAEKYLNWLLDLLSSDKILVTHTDLQKFESTTLQDHYQINLQDYIVEISHNHQSENDKHSYVMLFNNIQKINDGMASKAVLAYIPLTEQQFQEFKYTADDQIGRKRKEYEEKRFREAMTPVDELLERISQPTPAVKTEEPVSVEAPTAPDFVTQDQPETDPEHLLEASSPSSNFSTTTPIST